MKKTGLLIILIMIFLLTGCRIKKNSGSEGVMTDKITSQMDTDGADPWILKENNVYYYTKTTGNNVTIFSSNQLSDVAAGESKVIYESDSKLENFWAPEIHHLDNVWYIYFAANPFDNEIHRMYVLINPNNNPMEGDWECMEMKGMDDKFAIDGTILELDSGRYFIWSGWEGYENVQQNLYIAKMKSPTEVKKEKILLSEPEYDWEKQGNPLINEAPQILIKDNTVNLIYSASGSWTNDYCLGLLTASKDADVTNLSNWKKESKPIFKSANEIYGPGHNGFAKSPDEKEDYIIYHSARWDGAGWNRSVRLQKIEFDENGKIKTDTPLSSDTLMSAPSGETKRLRFTAEDFDYTEGIQTKESNTFKTAVTGFETTEETLSLNFELSEEKEYTIFIYAKIEDCYDEKYQSGLDITVNGEESTKKLFPSEYYQPIMLRYGMKKGENEIKIQSEAGGDQLSIERIELMPVQ